MWYPLLILCSMLCRNSEKEMMCTEAMLEDLGCQLTSRPMIYWLHAKTLSRLSCGSTHVDCVRGVKECLDPLSQYLIHQNVTTLCRYNWCKHNMHSFNIFSKYKVKIPFLKFRKQKFHHSDYKTLKWVIYWVAGKDSTGILLRHVVLLLNISKSYLLVLSPQSAYQFDGMSY